MLLKFLLVYLVSTLSAFLGRSCNKPVVRKGIMEWPSDGRVIITSIPKSPLAIIQSDPGQGPDSERVYLKSAKYKIRA